MILRNELIPGIQPCRYPLDLFCIQDPGTQCSVDRYRLRKSILNVISEYD
jgi:hypothetical protein